jgi:hypothetical protein
VAIGNWPLLAGAVAWTVRGPRRVNIAQAKKDAYARRFYNKPFSNCDDLMGAVSFWIGCRMPPSSLQDFLAAIEPDSKWREDPDYDVAKKRDRGRINYGPAFGELTGGYWDKWEKDND